jgi:DNA-binding PadR family transcriptional regulator
MARKKTKGTELSVFSGREESLNRVIFLILYSKKLLASYDMYKEIRGMKGFRHIDSRTVYRRMEALEKQGWIRQKGTRPARPGWDSTLYELTLRGKAALKLDGKSIDEFLRKATDEQLLKLIDALG